MGRSDRSMESKFVLAPTQLCSRGPATLEEWEALSSKLCTMQRSMPWWIGDMIVMGEATQGDDIWQAIDETFSLDLLQRYAAVCREFPPNERNATLSFTQHQLLMGLPKQLQKTLLGRAESEGWNTDTMRRKLKEIQSG